MLHHPRAAVLWSECVRQVGDVGRDIIEAVARRSPAGEGLELLVRGEYLAYGVLLCVVEQQVGSLVQNLYAFAVLHVENLSGEVRGESHQRQSWVPRGIYSGREDAVVLDADLVDFAVVDDYCAAVVRTHVEEHTAGVVGLIVVAVHAVVLVVVECAVVLINRRLLVGGEVTLIDAELAVELVARFNEAIGEVGVYRLIGDTEGDGSVAFPLSVAPRINCYLCRLAGICLKQGAPRGCVGLHETA